VVISCAQGRKTALELTRLAEPLIAGQRQSRRVLGVGTVCHSMNPSEEPILNH